MQMLIPLSFFNWCSYTFDTLVCPDLGISLVELSVTCPGSYYSSDPTSLKPLVADLDTEHGNVSGLDLVDLEEDADNISEEESNVADHLASLLSDNVGNGTVQVVGDNWFFALKVRFEFSYKILVIMQC